METQNNKSAVVGIVIVIIVILIGAWWLSRQVLVGPNPAAIGGLGAQVSGTTTPSTLPKLTVNDQLPGPAIIVSDVTLPAGGWVVIKLASGEAPGRSVAAGYFDAATHAGEIDLPTPTVAGQKFFAQLYSDNGDQRFNPAADSPLLGPDGQPILTSFAITTNLPAKKG